MRSSRLSPRANPASLPQPSLSSGARLIFWALLGVVSGGCVGRSDHVERPHLSVAIEARTGHGLRTNASVLAGGLPPGIRWEDGLSGDEAVAMALWNNAGFQESLSKLGLARADLAQAGLLTNPTFSMLFPVGPKQMEFVATFPLEAFWLRPRRLAIAQIEAERVAGALVQGGLDLIRDVRIGLSDLALARDRETLARGALALRERILGIAEVRQRAGEASVLESDAARAEVLRAREEARRLEHDVALAREHLLLMIGWAASGIHVEFTAPGPAPVRVESSAELERRALAARPDLRASELGLESAARRAGLAKAEIFALSGLVDANGAGRSGFEIGPGIALPVPIFNQNQAGRTRAQAEMERAAWNLAGTRQRILVEVREAWIRLQQSAEALSSFERDQLPALEELERRSQRAYELGDLSPLAVHENTRQLLIARVRQAELTAASRRAWAELERSVGQRLNPNPSPEPALP